MLIPILFLGLLGYGAWRLFGDTSTGSPSPTGTPDDSIPPIQEFDVIPIYAATSDKDRPTLDQLLTLGGGSRIMAFVARPGGPPLQANLIVAGSPFEGPGGVMRVAAVYASAVARPKTWTGTDPIVGSGFVFDASKIYYVYPAGKSLVTE